MSILLFSKIPLTFTPPISIWKRLDLFALARRCWASDGQTHNLVTRRPSDSGRCRAGPRRARDLAGAGPGRARDLANAAGVAGNLVRRRGGRSRGRDPAERAGGERGEDVMGRWDLEEGCGGEVQTGGEGNGMRVRGSVSEQDERRAGESRAQVGTAESERKDEGA